MLKWLSTYYVGPKIKNAAGIQAKINEGKAVPGVYLLTLSYNPDNIVELVPALVLVQKKLYADCPLIIGMAADKKEAIELFRKILTKVYKETGQCRIEEFVKRR